MTPRERKYLERQKRIRHLMGMIAFRLNGPRFQKSYRKDWAVDVRGILNAQEIMQKMYRPWSVVDLARRLKLVNQPPVDTELSTKIEYQPTPEKFDGPRLPNYTLDEYNIFVIPSSLPGRMWLCGPLPSIEIGK